MPYNDVRFVAIGKNEDTLIAEQVPFPLYLSFHSREFHETQHVTIPAYALQS